MSQVYNLEPPTKGKVVLRTTLGDLDIELWPKEAPRAVRNFVQLCLEGYYDGTIFHRLMKDFLFQGGDPTGTGDGGESIYGHPFADEFHSRLKFNHRGLVACANQNQPNTNGSQFFITLDRTDHLDRKATIFGKVTGDTLYNLARFNELETEGDDRPVDPPRVVRADVLWNPFEDIKPRVDREALEAAAEAAAKAKSEVAAKKQRKGAKNFALISFGDEAEEEDAAEVEAAAKIRSAHDALNDEKLSREAAVEIDLAKVRQAMQAAKDASASRSKAAAAGVGGDEDFGERMRQKVASKRKTPLDPTTQAAPVQDAQDGARDDEEEADSERDDEDGDGARTAKRSRMDGLSKAARTSAAVVAPSRQIKVQNRELLTDWERRRQEYKERKRLGGRREQDTMSKLKSFLGKMKSAGGKEGSSAETAHAGGEQGAVAPGSTALQAGEEVEAGYNGEIDKDLDHRKYMPAAWRLDDYLGGDDGDDDGGSLETLRGHRFEFGDGKKEGTRQPDSLDQYVVLDPLLEMGKAKFNRQQQQRKKRDNEWAGRSRD